METSSKSNGTSPGVSRVSRFMLLWHFFQSFHVTAPPEKKVAKTEKTKVDDTSSSDDAALPVEEILSKHNLPTKLPSIIDIKKAIPQHCFEPITKLSIYYMCKDFFYVVCLYFLSEWSWQYLPRSTQLVLSPLYWFVQGTIHTAIFVVGHDAGHGSFSNSELVNSICGNICHTFVLCPYYMWKLSHRHHHKNTGNIDKDEVFYPVRKSDNKYEFVIPGFGLAIGWFCYLARGYRPRMVNHFNPWFPMFQRHVLDCVLSMACLIGWGLALNMWREQYGWTSLVYHHTIPCIIFGSYIVIITFLHHTEKGIPWYGDHVWDNVRGQLSSVDRSYGWCHDLMHNIGTHQIHHLFPKIPHYNIEEATVHFRKAFPQLVNIRNDYILPAFCRNFFKYLAQTEVADQAQVHIYK